MPAFLRLRLWLRYGQQRERALVGAATALAVALLCLAVVPMLDGTEEPTGPSVAVAGVPGTTAPSTPGSTPAQESGGATVGSAPEASGGATGPAATADGGPAVAAAATSGGEDRCGTRTASAPGITTSEVRIDVSLVSLAGPVGNSTVGVRPDLHEMVDALVADINRTGGIACGRKLVAKKYDVNPIDANDQQAKCLDMVQDKPFLVLDQAGYVRPQARACFVQNKLPFQLSTAGTSAEVKRSYPYLFGISATAEKQVRDGILGLAERGFFQAPAFKKLGLYLEACVPEVNAEIDAALAKVGVKPNQVSKFTLGCNIIASPSEISQGVLQHKGEDASHVFLASSILNNQNYTKIAAQQLYRPVYGASDFGDNTAAPVARQWDPSFDGAVIPSSTRSGDLNSGIRTEEAAACDKVLRAAGLRGIETEAPDATALAMCDSFSFFRRIIDAAGANPTRQSFIEAVTGIGLFKTSSRGDGVFDRPGKVTGGDFHRPLRWENACGCFKAVVPEFRPGF